MNTFLLGMCIIFFGYLCMMIHIAKHWRDHSLHLSKEYDAS